MTRNNPFQFSGNQIMFQRKTMFRAASAACVICLSPNIAIYAQESAEEELDEVVVRAHPLSAEELAQPVSTLRGKEIERAMAPSLAETLRGIPGVTSASFGQAVGRPVIRGLGGARVKTLEDRIDSMDVSVTSPDHLTTIEPFNAQSIEVLKGPATLLYGTGAIGGVVNVNTGRIPNEVPDKFGGKVDVRGADNADQRFSAVSLNGGAGSLAFHVNAYYRDGNEYEIPGFAESEILHEHEEEEEHHEEEHHEEEEEIFGRLENSQMEVRGGSAGLSYIGDRSYIGLSVSTYGAEYGLPGGHGHHEHGHHEEEEGHEEEEHHEEEEGGAILDLDQTRFDLEAGIDSPFAGFSSLNFRLGYNDYEHVEFEGNGEAGTVFANEALEARLEIAHGAGSDTEGAMGLQVSSRDFSAIGAEAFVEPVKTDSFGLFYVSKLRFDRTDLEYGVRYEKVDHDPSNNFSREFNLGAASLGLIRPLTETWTLSGTLDVSNRAPVAEELYSDGPHLAIGTYEIGNPNLKKESAINVSAALAYEQDSLSFLMNAYHTNFTDFIYESATGAEIDELPVLQWVQGDATFHGLEADIGWEAMRWEDGTLTLNAGFDLVDAQLDEGANRNLPRIPPRRWRVGAIVNWGNFLAEVEWMTVDDQTDVATNELPTEGYNDLRMYLGYEMSIGDSFLEVFLSGRNLTNEEQRYHTSFIKDLAPMPGRTIEAGFIFRL